MPSDRRGGSERGKERGIKGVFCIFSFRRVSGACAERVVSNSLRGSKHYANYG